MTASDREGEKLAASIRKVRASATSKPTPTSGAAQQPTARPGSSTSTGSAAKRSGPTDPYHYGRRIWPD
jgi:hypothetical protein